MIAVSQSIAQAKVALSNLELLRARPAMKTVDVQGLRVRVERAADHVMHGFINCGLESIDVVLGEALDSPEAYFILATDESGTPSHRLALGFSSQSAAKAEAGEGARLIPMDITLAKALLFGPTGPVGNAVASLLNDAMQAIAHKRDVQLWTVERIAAAELSLEHDAALTKLAELVGTAPTAVFLRALTKFLMHAYDAIPALSSDLTKAVEARKAVEAVALAVEKCFAFQPEQVETVKRLSLVEKADAEVHYVLGVVLEPETVDAQGDIYSAEEIQKSCYRFMKSYQNVGLMHRGLINESAYVVENYIQPKDDELNGQPLKAGTWMMKIAIEDPELWTEISQGRLTGLSIGGFASKTPV